MAGLLARALLVGAVLMGAPGATPVWAQSADPETRELLDRVERLQRDLATLQRQVYRGGATSPEAGGGGASSGAATPPTLAAEMQVRLDEIEGQIRSLTGRLEETNHAITQLERKLEVVTSDMDVRMKALESGAASQPGVGQGPPSGPQGQAQGQSQGGPPPASAAPSQPGVLGALPVERPGQETAEVQPDTGKQAISLPDGSPEEQYSYATAFLARSDWNGAERALELFLAANPKHELSANAQYWLGETHYVRGDYNNAALAFAKGYKNFPKGQKGPDNLLKLGLSLANLNKKDSACATFERFGQDFPGASAQLKSRVATESNKLGCN